jgi:hypothetical protein
MVPLLRQRKPRAWFMPFDRGTAETAEARPRRLAVLLPVALLGGYLLFCHGCHGDEDNELFAGLHLASPDLASR